MSSDVGETENFLFIAIGCGFTVVVVGAGILMYYLVTCCCKRCKKEMPQIQINDATESYNPPDSAPQKTCFMCQQPKDQVGSNHFNCTMDAMDNSIV